MCSLDVQAVRQSDLRRRFRPAGLATGIGSVPHENADHAVNLVLEQLPEFPFWPQLPRRSPLEGMTLQYLEGFPALRRRGDDLFVDTGAEGYGELEAYYKRVFSGEPGGFEVSPERAEGLYAFERALLRKRPPDLRYVKGHVTGPVTLSSALRDPAGREIAYDDAYRDVVATFVAHKAQWQTARLQAFGVPVVMFLDEPVMEVYGSAYSALSAELVTALWGPSLELLRDEGVLSAIHCCGNTDWDLLFESGVDIVNFDAFHYLDRMILYAEGLDRYLRQGGTLAWGLVPTSPESEGLGAADLLAFWEGALSRFREAGVEEDLLRERCVITPSCGMGSLEPALAERILGLLAEVSASVRDRGRE